MYIIKEKATPLFKFKFKFNDTFYRWTTKGIYKYIYNIYIYIHIYMYIYKSTVGKGKQ